MPWYSDRSRYEAGYLCPWRRLLGYHAGGMGFVPTSESTEQAAGQYIHDVLANVLRLPASATRSDVDTAIRDTDALRHYLLTRALIFSEDDLFEYRGVVHGWARTVMPWLLADYEVVSTEEEITLDLGDDIRWMARPDFVLRSREHGYLVDCDFKSTRSKVDRIGQMHVASLQAIMNSYAISQKYGEPVREVQIHCIQLGKQPWPTPITHAYYRPGQPPYVAEDWQPKNRTPDGKWLGKLYRKVEVRNHREVGDWVWSMPPATLADLFPVTRQQFNPDDQGLRYAQALDSIRTTERWWRERVTPIDWDKVTPLQLSATFPRTFACHEYGRDCEFFEACFAPATFATEGHPTGPLYNRMITRTPHHPQEGEK